VVARFLTISKIG
jgi:hypothetical protein